ncbi:MAG: GFA family protein [Deltaproteobacteria bacterium]|nr:GFA family protein [Deltaproteobacteria bacterium]
MTENSDSNKTKGRCLCGQVQFEIQGELRNIVNCHCSKCRKFHGNFGAYTSVKVENLKITEDKGLKWYQSPTDETPNVHRGFCSECGSSLFWHPEDKPDIAVTAGSLEEPTNLKTIGHIWCCQLPDFYEILDDLPKFDQRWKT